jgi:hypothetical protein
MFWLSVSRPDYRESTRPLISTLYFCVRSTPVHKMAGNMKNLLNKARDAANKRKSEGSSQGSPTKVKRVQHLSLVHFLPAQGMQTGIVFKGKEFQEFHRYIRENAPDLLKKDSGLGIASTGHRITYGKHDENYVNTWIWNMNPKEEAETMLAIVFELLKGKNVEISVQNVPIENSLQLAGMAHVVKGCPADLFLDKVYTPVIVQLDVKNGQYGVLFLDGTYIYKEILKQYGFGFEEVESQGDTKKAWGKYFADHEVCRSVMCLLQSEMEMPGVVIMLDEDNCTPQHLYQMWHICFRMTLENANVEVPADTMAEEIYTTKAEKATVHMSAWYTAKKVVSFAADVILSGEDFVKKSVGVHTEEYILFKILVAFLTEPSA